MMMMRSKLLKSCKENNPISRSYYQLVFKKHKHELQKKRPRYTFLNSNQFATGQQSKGTQNKWNAAAAVVTGLGISFLVATKTKQLNYEMLCEEAPVSNLVSNGKAMKLEDAIEKSRDLLQRMKDETGSPGVTVGVSVNGKNVWMEGLGYADIENRVLCTPETVFRIASISKSITMGLVAKLWENGDLDLDKSIYHYLPNFPVKYFDGKKVDITTRQLVSHLGGIRHYNKDYMKKNLEEGKTEKDNKSSDESSHPKSRAECTRNEGVQNSSVKSSNPKSAGDNTDKDGNQKKKVKSEFDEKEYFIKRHYATVTDSLTLFQDDPLVHRPGSKFLYTTHGWTLISAVMEKAANKPFNVLMKDYFKCLGLEHTYFEENDKIIYHRGRHYMKDKKGRIINIPYTDLSYKWAGGGFISNVIDIIKFGNIMLYSYQQNEENQSITEKSILKKGNDEKGDAETLKPNKKGNNSNFHQLPGYLKKATVKMLFSPITERYSKTEDKYYGMGWEVIPAKHEYGECFHEKQYTVHTGGAIGASSVLLIYPSDKKGNDGDQIKHKLSGMVTLPPHGVVVAIIVNIGSVNLTSTAVQIAKNFENINQDGIRN